MLIANQYIGLGAGGASPPAAMRFARATPQYLSRVLATAGGSTVRFTYSMWVKGTSFDPGGGFPTLPLYEVIISPGIASGTFDVTLIFTLTSDVMEINQSTGGVDWDETYEFPGGSSFPFNTWTHLVIQYDSSQGTAANRIRAYQQGTALSPAVAENTPTLNEAHKMFTNGYTHLIGRTDDNQGVTRFDGKMAFIELIDGISLDPTSFAFNNGGIWTRKPYTGSYGPNGFALDGSAGVGIDVSGNGQHFTGVNMSSADLDFTDLPPYIL